MSFTAGFIPARPPEFPMGRLPAGTVGCNTKICFVCSYVMSEAYKKVFSVVSHRCAADDRCLQHKCKEQLKGISAEALGIQPSFACPLPEAVSVCGDCEEAGVKTSL